MTDPINKPFILDPDVIAYLVEKAVAHRHWYGPGWGAPWCHRVKSKSNE